MVPWPLLYARVDDVVRGVRFVVMEVELIEPTLYLGFASGAGDRLAVAILDSLQGR